MKFADPVDALASIWGYSAFRPLQSEIIQHVLKQKDVLVIMPTGGGKSLCFQIPALCLEGLCIVVTPIIALMKDQVEQLKQKGVSAAAIYSGMSNPEIDLTLDNAVFGQLKFLYVSPERLKSELFIERTRKMQVSLLVVDEAHCISQWGYDFRPSYLLIHEFKQYVPDSSLIALTATATRDVAGDIITKLELREDYKVFVQSFARPNLAYFVRKVEDKEAKMVEILKKIKGQAIVYVRTRKNAKTIAEYLLNQEIGADYYHAGLSHPLRNTKQEAWMKNKFRVMVATNAFGMGINKPDVRVVIHFDLPANLESYYQEAGRAGRDGLKSYAVQLFQEADPDDLMTRVVSAAPEPDVLKKMYQSLANYYKIAVGSSLLTTYDFELSEFVSRYNLDYLESFHALKKLEEQGFIQLTESFYHPSRVKILLDHMELYKFEVANAPFEPVIKGLLRIYGGELYTHFLTISEKKMAVFLHLSVSEVERKLKSLHAQHVIYYDQRKDKPQITFTTSRYDAGKLPLDVKYLKERRKIDLQKAEAVIDYISRQRTCRSEIIQEYFGETPAGECGLCDHCIGKKQRREGILFDEKLRHNLRRVIGRKGRQIQEIMADAPETEKENWLEAIREMLDSEELYFDENGILHAAD